MQNSTIEWTDNTFNPWEGCTKVAPECANCYAAARNRHWGGGKNWGPGAPRRHTSAANWELPAKWNLKAMSAGRRQRVFCASLADFFDHEVDKLGWRDDVWQIIRETPYLDWLILTKRPELIADRLPLDWGMGYSNVWLGTTVGCQDSLFRLKALLHVPASIHFLSAEPLLEYVDVKPTVRESPFNLDWMIMGGESGSGARVCEIGWIQQMLADCDLMSIKPFVKQLGRSPSLQGKVLNLKDKKGGNIREWPSLGRGVRQFPSLNKERPSQ